VVALVLASILGVGGACSGDDDTSSTTAALGSPLGQCEGSVVRRVDGGHPGADALPPLESIVTDRSAAEAAFAQVEEEIQGRYGATAVKLGDGFGRAWTVENGGNYDVVDVDDFGIVITLASSAACPTESDLHVSEARLPLFCFAP